MEKETRMYTVLGRTKILRLKLNIYYIYIYYGFLTLKKVEK